MIQEKRNLHLRLQEYCDCYLETDPRKELDHISAGGETSDVTADPEEVALKFLSLAVLYGIKENAKKLVITKTDGGEVQLNIEAAGKYKLPPPPQNIGEKVFQVMHSVTHLEGREGKEPLSLGIRNDRLELGIAFQSGGGEETLTLTFPPI